MKKDCCQVPTNLKREIVSPDKTIDTCQVCRCRHFHMQAEPGMFGLYFNQGK